MASEIEPDNIRQPHHARPGETQKMTTDTARQGPRGTRVLAVLAAALVLAVAIGALLVLGFPKT